MKILIADDHDLVREAIIAFIASEGLTDVTGVGSLPEAVKVVSAEGAESFDLVLLDYDMPGMKGLTGLAEMQKLMGPKPVAILSGIAAQSVARQALEAGAKGFLPKTLSAKSLGAAIRFIAAGQVFVPYDFIAREEKKTVDNLTQRETEVLKGLCGGQSNKEIAQDLDLQEVTVKLHVKTLCRKLGAKNRTQAAMIGKDKLA